MLNCLSLKGYRPSADYTDYVVKNLHDVDDD